MDYNTKKKEKERQGKIVILPQRKRYKGPLGEFEFSTEEFEVTYKDTPFGWLEVLLYRGTETEGYKIHIPEGVVNCSYMFEGTMLQTPPVIPVGVKNVNYMFANCVSLKRGALLPDGVTTASFLYQGDRSLESSPALPNTLENGSYLFDGCTHLLEPPKIGSRLKNATGMFRNCFRLQQEAVFPDGVRAEHAYRGCKTLQDEDWDFRDEMDL